MTRTINPRGGRGVSGRAFSNWGSGRFSSLMLLDEWSFRIVSKIHGTLSLPPPACMPLQSLSVGRYRLGLCENDRLRFCLPACLYGRRKRELIREGVNLSVCVSCVGRVCMAAEKGSGIRLCSWPSPCFLSPYLSISLDFRGYGGRGPETGRGMRVRGGTRVGKAGEACGDLIRHQGSISLT